MVKTGFLHYNKGGKGGACMGFSENLKRIRKEKGMSQEELAELLDVSRQAVSKWEQDMGYPEVEKLLLISRKLAVSLDELMFSETAAEPTWNGEILISSPNENVVVNCYKVGSSGKMPGGKSAPKYALFGRSRGTNSFWGEPTTYLGWYADEESVSKEIACINRALINRERAYTLQYSAKTKRSWAKIKIIEE
jgi:DNA-binding XRE family transcriptional regulator